MSTLLFERSLPRFAAARVVSTLGSGRGGRDRAVAAGRARRAGCTCEGWVHVEPTLSGICGSDLATLDGRSSRYFEDIVSFPFVPGHEVVGTVPEAAVGADGAALAAGTRVVLQPVLGCAARGIQPPCPACQAGNSGTAATSPSATSGRGCKRASAPIPAVAGRHPASWPTRASSTRCPKS